MSNYSSTWAAYAVNSTERCAAAAASVAAAAPHNRTRALIAHSDTTHSDGVNFITDTQLLLGLGLFLSLAFGVLGLGLECCTLTHTLSNKPFLIWLLTTHHTLNM